MGCSKFCTCFCCSTVITLLFVLCFLLYLSLHADNPHIFIENAVLTRFSVANSPSDSKMKVIDYNLTVDVKFRNFNKRSRIQYSRLGVTVFLDGHRLAWAPLPVVRQGTKNTTSLTAVMQGQSPVEVSDSGVGFFQTAADAGVFVLDFEVDGRLRFRYGGAKTLKSSFLRLSARSFQRKPHDCRFLTGDVWKRVCLHPGTMQVPTTPLGRLTNM